MSLANAGKLAQAARKTSPDAVQGDVDLVQMAKTLPEDEFAQAAQRWTIRHQSTDDLAAQHRRNRYELQFTEGTAGQVMPGARQNGLVEVLSATHDPNVCSTPIHEFSRRGHREWVCYKRNTI